MLTYSLALAELAPADTLATLGALSLAELAELAEVADEAEPAPEDEHPASTAIDPASTAATTKPIHFLAVAFIALIPSLSSNTLRHMLYAPRKQLNARNRDDMEDNRSIERIKRSAARSETQWFLVTYNECRNNNNSTRRHNHGLRRPDT